MNNLFGPIDDLKFDGHRLSIYNSMQQPIALREGNRNSNSIIILYSDEQIRSMLQKAIRGNGVVQTSSSFINSFIDKMVFANVGNIFGNDLHNWKCITFERIGLDNTFSGAMTRFPDDPVIFIPSRMAEHRTGSSLLVLVNKTVI